MKSFPLWWLPLALALASTACGSDDGGSCTAMYFSNTVTFNLHPEISASGSYTIHATADNQSSDCSLAMGHPYQTDCVPQNIDFGIRLAPIAADAVTSIEVDTQTVAQTVSVSLTRDGATLFNVTKQPAYQRDEPNGKGCGFRSYAVIDLNW
jgi:hypothetical protein